MIDELSAVFAEHERLLKRVAEDLSDEIVNIAVLTAAAILAGRKVLVMGNGGSASDAQHFVAELVGRFQLERRALPAFCLTGDMATLTSICNDQGFVHAYQRQVEALAVPGDIVFAISTSGRSENVLLAAKAARAAGCVTIGLLGGDGGTIAPCVDHPLIVPSQVTARVQEAHITIIHALCQYVERRVVEAES
jgi:D-sedoheptulose 7-phosphate isomerase